MIPFSTTMMTTTIPIHATMMMTTNNTYGRLCLSYCSYVSEGAFIADAYPRRRPVAAHLFVTPEGRVPPLLPAFHLNLRLKNGGRPHHTPCEARVRVHRPCRREQPACGRTPVQYRSRIRARTRIVIAAIGDSRIPNFGWSLAPGQIHVHAPELVVQRLVLQIVIAAIDPPEKAGTHLVPRLPDWKPELLVRRTPSIKSAPTSQTITVVRFRQTVRPEGADTRCKSVKIIVPADGRTGNLHRNANICHDYKH